MRLVLKQNIEDIAFIDIETAPQVEELEIDSPLYDAWEYQVRREKLEVDDLQSSYFDRAGLYAEFGKIICITLGIVRGDKIRLKTFSGDEKELLIEFNETLEKFVNNKTWLCGHAIVDFDAPYIMKRCLSHRIKLHPLFDVAHLKPWEVDYLDTALLWKGTSFKKSTLISVCTALGIDSPKDDISGAEVGKYFYMGEIDRICRYCEKDVIAVINVLRAFRYEEPLEVAEMTEPEDVGILEYLFNGGKYTEEVQEALKETVNSLPLDKKEMAIEILGAVPSRAKGKITHLTRKNIKQLCD